MTKSIARWPLSGAYRLIMSLLAAGALGAPMLLGGCGARSAGPVNWNERLAETRQTDTLEAWRAFVAEAPEGELKQAARLQLAQREVQAIGPSTTVAEIDGLLTRFGDTPQVPALRQARVEAAFREEVMSQQRAPVAMRAAWEAFAARHGAAAQRFNGEQRVNEAVLATIRDTRPTGVALLQLIGTMYAPEAGQRGAIEDALKRVIMQQPSESAFVSALDGQLPGWFTATGRREIINTHRERRATRLMETATAASDLRPVLDAMGEDAFAPAAQRVRQRYDELMVAQLGATPTLEQARAYVADPYTERLRAALLSEISAIEAPVNTTSSARIEQLLQRQPPPLMRAALEERLNEMRMLIFLREETDRLLGRVYTPSDEEIIRSRQRERRPREQQPLSLIQQLPHVDRTHVLLEAENIFTTVVVLSNSGLLLGLNYELARLKPPVASVRLPNGESVRALFAKSDTLRGFVLYRLENPGPVMVPGTGQLEPARLRNPVWIQYGYHLDVRFNLGSVGGLKQAATIERKNNDLPGSTTAQTIVFRPETSSPMDGGVLYEANGEVIAIIAQRSRDARWFALGFNEAHEMLRAYRDELLGD